MLKGRIGTVELIWATWVELESNLNAHTIQTQPNPTRNTWAALQKVELNTLKVVGNSILTKTNPNPCTPLYINLAIDHQRCEGRYPTNQVENCQTLIEVGATKMSSQPFNQLLYAIRHNTHFGFYKNYEYKAQIPSYLIVHSLNITNCKALQR